ncbi:Carnitine O-palmitoyltransferase 2, mitochondrial [Oopsacas minuta]|uniref:Carnitine O-palmitoyltransferase 2, mitochondrial n=1 Tax=Oopsacas minuta TaxID=111878 RepID=A0AAV7JII5_9METZ|nr:Carnitine O-palmitoyltransferase 2, mitochondrial [Oopsacas minuta]
MLKYPLTQTVNIIFWNRKCLSHFSNIFPHSAYLEKSTLPTLYFQPYLPQLPIPTLQNSCQLYLTAVKPLLNSEQYSHISSLVDKLQTEGRHLQYELVARNKLNKQTSYITGPWTDRYLRDRSSVVLTHNAFIGLKPDLQTMDPLKRAAKMISITARFKASLLDGQLKPMIYHTQPIKSDTESYARLMKLLPGRLKIYTSYLYYKAYPLDMVQFSNLFNSTRIPMPEKDILTCNTNARHICVVVNGNFYTFDVFLPDKSVLSTDEIYNNLLKIKQGSGDYPKHPVSILTAADRDTWTSARAELVQIELNAKSIKLIDESLYILCLDSQESVSASEYTKAMLHGDGINRWFDKSFQLIFQPNGHCSIHFEHSWGDGVALLRLFNALYEQSKITSVDPQNIQLNDAKVNEVKFELTDNLIQTIEKVKTEFYTRTKGLKVQELQIIRAGKHYFKKVELSSDAVIQLAIQMAYFLISGGKTAATYESASTSAFKHGRTETVRPCTFETLQCTKAILNGKLSTPQLLELMKACSRKHSTLVKQAVMGKGFDRHLFGLSCLANELGGTIPKIFTDEVHKYINHFTMSTSTLDSEAVLVGGFAPVVHDGYGIGYGIREDRIEANVTAYEGREVKQFTDALTNSINMLLDLLDEK